ncbi:hypothetical protein B0T20DRAFT_125148 [Sordaria brevicollis]|uniref:Uncharacterized protein n=1 Tax=Sordaria brevicollis TaxID=83679 RepID=A0AAE0PL46_SORBR|nr:hypothetical protein B0T20DRAFT_125148 [Sordaria brevicollis]
MNATSSSLSPEQHSVAVKVLFNLPPKHWMRKKMNSWRRNTQRLQDSRRVQQSSSLHQPRHLLSRIITKRRPDKSSNPRNDSSDNVTGLGGGSIEVQLMSLGGAVSSHCSCGRGKCLSCRCDVSASLPPPSSLLLLGQTCRPLSFHAPCNKDSDACRPVPCMTLLQLPHFRPPLASSTFHQPNDAGPDILTEGYLEPKMTWEFIYGRCQPCL